MSALSCLQRFHLRSCSSTAAGVAGAPVPAKKVLVRRAVRTWVRVSEPAYDEEGEHQARLTASMHQAQAPEQQQQQQQQQLRPRNQSPLKYAQMGHSRFGRGAPHVCYSQLGDNGVFYMKPEADELLGDWQQWLHQQQLQHQQHWQQQRQQLQAWAHAQGSGSRQVPLQGLGFRAADAAATAAPGSHDPATAAQANSSSSSSATIASNARASKEGADRRRLLDGMLSSTAAGGMAGLAAAAAAALGVGNSSGSGDSSGSGGGSGGSSSSGGHLRAGGSGPLARVQHLLLGMVIGAVGSVLLMLYCKAVLAALLLCYAGFALGM
ncbi:hypothetical protein COO60DRAFT_638331 [Scenedesmus sp. NREL 46B-D3]|nr:hypothetical protein COO60DRAFT_638331 [Scenedesmus sp. NREL 46B-D3]